MGLQAHKMQTPIAVPRTNRWGACKRLCGDSGFGESAAGTFMSYFLVEEGAGDASAQ